MSGPSYFVKLVADRDEEHDPHDWLPPLDRRAVMRMLGMTAVASLLGSCGTGSPSTSSGGTATTTTLAASATEASAGASITLTAGVTPTAATGRVVLYNGSTSLGIAGVASGGASIPVSFSAAGTETLTAMYQGDNVYAESTSAPVSITVTGDAAASAACSQTLEGEEGPYFVDDSASGYNRSNILSNLDGSNIQTGVAFTLTIYVYDGRNGCSPMAGVQVDIWHCNASGVYSAEESEGTVEETWLRGYQISDANGMVKFVTIVPGWYQGRTTHIHLRLRSTYDSSTTGGTNTMQLFFDQTLIDTLDTTVSPYSGEGRNPTSNASDRVYADEEDGTTLMTVTGSASAGYAAMASIYLPIS
jgi:protocatechuate 3,4-dioxygenase beta subunit